MKTPILVLSMLCLLLCLSPMSMAVEYDGPEIKRWTKMEKDDKGEMKEVKYMTIDGIMVHEDDPKIQPQPTVITPGTESSPENAGTAPSDAIVLFDGSSLKSWTDTKGKKTKWKLDGGALSPTKVSGMIQTRQKFGSCQLHLEWATPGKTEGSGQGRGNSGVFLMGQYEVQILDNYRNTTYPDGQAGALYGRSKPLVNASRKPGEWQSYDIIFHRPVFENGEVVKRATFTVFHNGVLIQDHYELTGGTGWEGGSSISGYTPHADQGPLQLQDHGNPVLFRNIWVRELED